jgi:hypothetical protein
MRKICGYAQQILQRLKLKNQNSSIGITTVYWLDGGVSIPGKGKKFFSAAQRPDPLWGPLNHQSNGYRRLFPRG